MGRSPALNSRNKPFSSDVSLLTHNVMPSVTATASVGEDGRKGMADLMTTEGRRMSGDLARELAENRATENTTPRTE